MGDTAADRDAPPPRWVRIAAHAAALTPLPSALWRLLLVFGLPAGYTARGLDGLGVDGWGRVGVLGLSVFSELAALLTLGLVQRWGEVVPRWVPVVGGRPVRRRPVVVLAGVGAVALTVLWTPLLGWWALDHPGMTSTGATVVGVLYLPLVAWGPLLGAVTCWYARRPRALRGAPDGDGPGWSLRRSAAEPGVQP